MPMVAGASPFSVALRKVDAGDHLGQFRIEGKPDIQEIRIAGGYAFCWNHISVTMTPLQGGSSKQRAEHILSVFRKEPDGRWLLFRDANLLTPI